MDEARYRKYRQCILSHLPELTREVGHYERELMGSMPGDDGSVGSVLESVVWIALDDAAACRDDDRVRRGAKLTHALMNFDDSEVRNEVIIGLVKPAAATPRVRKAFRELGFDELVAMGDAFNHPRRRGPALDDPDRVPSRTTTVMRWMRRRP